MTVVKRAIIFTMLGGMLMAMTPAARADISVVASVDRNRIPLGETFSYTITVNGTQGGIGAGSPGVDGLAFSNPSQNTTMSINNSQMSQSISLVYQVTPMRTGEFTIPSVPVKVGDQQFQTQPITITVEKAVVQQDTQQSLFGRVRLDAKRLYLGQVVPLDVYLFARQDVPLKGISGFQSEADGLNYKYNSRIRSGSETIGGQAFRVFQIEGAVSPSKPGQLMFGPCILKCQLAVKRNGSGGWPFGDSMFDELMGRSETKETPVTIDATPIEVLPLPEQGRPADFAGAVGRWNMDVSAMPTNVTVGDPITVTIKITGEGNIDTVPTPKLAGLEDFKAYDPTSKTTKNELSTQGERDFQQVLIAKSADVKQLPEIRLVYFDPIAERYETASRGPIPMTVKAGSAGATTIVGGDTPVRTREKLGQDIVYLKGDLGTVAKTVPFCSTPAFWFLNFLPVVSLAGIGAWKRRSDKLRGDIAYARRSRAAVNARNLLAAARGYEQIQRALQNYLGDRLNIPTSGITASIVDEQLVPRGLSVDLVEKLKACFEACDNARFAGMGNNEADMQSIANTVKELIDELENIRF